MKRKYIKPAIEKVLLDNSISLQMQSSPHNPDPRSGGSKGSDDPFQSPFEEKPFS